ncbi:hypothetical protein IGI04_040458 [Brassica rapa subsp. trilocularis]|uniref:At2g35280-like TPR domain-containing protein n=1 Tax=Brassica rapa subsp. trilocularis TaxID=1813537 RepID=A0ABQ7KMW0_BRACM|nr:hypothetical protein IGI04_040458 [Brassica rapa subsp. trilocularis]
MEFFPLLELPEEIQAVVVERAARNSIQDLYGLKASSRSMKVLAERRGVYHFLDVLSVSWGLNMPSELLKACYDEGNPSTLYIKGVQFFYSLDLHEEGLSLMKRAADAGYECVVYTHAMTRAIFEGEGKYFDGIPFESVDRIDANVQILWHIDVTKDDNMCNRCFWIKELGLFLRDFERISLLRDTRKVGENIKKLMATEFDHAHNNGLDLHWSG